MRPSQLIHDELMSVLSSVSYTLQDTGFQAILVGMILKGGASNVREHFLSHRTGVEGAGCGCAGNRKSKDHLQAPRSGMNCLRPRRTI